MQFTYIASNREANNNGASKIARFSPYLLGVSLARFATITLQACAILCHVVLHDADRIDQEKTMNIATQSASGSPVASLISERQLTLNISDEQLAMAIGFKRSSIIAMIKAGKLKLPANKIVAIAAALSIDPAYFLRAHLAETAPEMLAAIDALTSQKLLTVNETKLIENYRFLAKGHDVTPVIMDGTNIVALLSI
jgi:transcriptional regulator with XRE-family HTH domain